MNLRVEPINQTEDKSKKIFASEECQTLLKMWAEFYPINGFNVPWIGYFIFENDAIVGTCAFTGKPVNNCVEISYWTFPAHEGKGIASWACKALISMAKKAESGIVVTAKTAPEHNASTKILEKNGLVFNAVVQDDEIGDAWEWMLKQ